MPSTYSSLLRLELMATGEKSATWGDITNTNLGTLLEKSIAGTATVSVTAGNVSLTALNGADDEARCAIINITGTPGVSRNVVAPSTSKTYCVINGSNAAVVFKGAATTGVTLSSGQRAWLAWNGSDFVTIGVPPDSPSFTGTSSFVNLTASGVVSLAAGAVGAPSLSFTGDLNNGWWSPAADTQAWSIAGAELMRLQSVGLGVGMTPVYRLDVTGGAGNGIRYVGPTAQMLLGESGSLGAVGTITNHALAFLANNTIVGRFSAAGNFGIGVSPSYVLDVKTSSNGATTPTARFGGTRSFFFQPETGSAFIYGPVLGFGAYVDTAAGNYIQPSGIGMQGGAVIAAPYAGGLEFYTYNAGVETGATQTLASTLRMVLSSAGNLGVGGITPSTRFHAGGAAAIEARLESNASLATGAGTSVLRFGGSNNATSGYVGFGGNAATIDLLNVIGGLRFSASNALAMQLTGAGQAQFPAIHNNGSGAAGTTPMIASGTYTPTFTNVAGTTANTPRTCQWLRVGNVCHVSGNIDVTCSSGAGVSWRLSLPIASNLANSWELGGTAARSGAPQFGGILILGDSTNNEATFSFTNDTNTLSLLYSFSFSYVVL